MNFAELSNPAQANAPVVVNRNFHALDGAGLYGYNEATTTGLTEGYLGGDFGTTAIAAGTVALTNTTTNYIVAHRTTGAVTTATTTTNWNDTTVYGRVRRCVTAGGVVTARIDWRFLEGGIFDRSGGTSGGLLAANNLSDVASASTSRTNLGLGTAAVLASDTDATLAANSNVRVPTQAAVKSYIDSLGLSGLRYLADTASTAASDPGAGNLRFNNATLASVTALYIDDSTSDGVDLSTLLGSLGSSGLVKITSVRDNGEWRIFKWTAAPTDNTGWWTFTVVDQAGLGTFEDDDELQVLFLQLAPGGTGAVATDTIWDAKGDLAAGTGSNTAAKLTAGTNGHVLTADSAEATGLKWAAASSGGTKTYAVLTPMTSQPPASNFATLDTRNSLAVLEFDASTEETTFWECVMPEGASLGSGLKVNVIWMADTATSGDVVWGVAIERGTTDIDSDSYDTEATATGTASGTSGIKTTTEITIATIDSVVAGDPFRLKLARKAASGSDTMTGDAQVRSVEVRSAA